MQCRKNATDSSNSMNRCQRGVKRPVLVAALVLAAAAGTAEGQSYFATKSMSWDVSARATDANRNPLVKKIGKWFGLTSAFADDKHGVPKLKRDVGASNKKSPELAMSVQTRMRNGKVNSREQRVNEANFRQDLLGTQGNPTQVYSKNQSAITGIHPSANASTLIEVEPARLGANGRGDPIQIIDATMTIQGRAKVLPLEPPKNVETSYAEAYSFAQLDLAGTITKSRWLDGTGKTGEFKKGTKSAKVDGEAAETRNSTAKQNHKAKGSASDPIVLSFFDEGTSELLASETLYQDRWFADGISSINWDDVDGFVIRADLADASAGFEFETLSDWVTNPTNGSVSILDGVFSATGDLAGLPWDVIQLEHELVVTLPASEYQPEASLFYDVSSLPDSVGDVSAVLSSDMSGFASEYRTVPAPGSLVLLAMATGLGLRRRRPGA